MIKRDRAKQVMVENVIALEIGNASVMVIGDVLGPCTPFTYSETYAGLRGPGSFVTAETLPPVNNRLNYNNQVDEDVRDLNLWGESVETFRPNLRAPFER